MQPRKHVKLTAHRSDDGSVEWALVSKWKKEKLKLQPAQFIYWREASTRGEWFCEQTIKQLSKIWTRSDDDSVMTEDARRNRLASWTQWQRQTRKQFETKASRRAVQQSIEYHIAHAFMYDAIKLLRRQNGTFPVPRILTATIRMSQFKLQRGVTNRDILIGDRISFFIRL